MKILDKSEYRFSEVTSSNIPRLRLAVSSLSIDCLIKGAIIESCIAIDKRILAITCDDVPHEDFLHISLIDQDSSIIDEISLGSIYSTGNFSNLNVIDDTSLTFNFIDNALWKLTALTNPNIHIPVLSDPVGAHRDLKLKKLIQIEKFKNI
ncbi:MAG: hypothetical protein K6L73_10035 [Cellvibrionaceae bacterium]